MEKKDGRAEKKSELSELEEIIYKDNSSEQEIIPTIVEEKPVLYYVYTITAYCGCYDCCGKTDGITASGVKAEQGVTIAADTNVLPFGTKVYIDGVGERIVQDRGGAIKGNRLDLYFSDHQSALNFGRQTRKVIILN